MTRKTALETYFSTVSPTYIENWNSALYELSIPQIDIPLSQEDTQSLGRSIHKYGHQFPDCPSSTLPSVTEKIKQALNHFPEGAFIRLGSRSAKDSYYALNRGLRITDAYSAIRMLTEASARVAFDLKLALNNNYNPHIFVREWIDMPDWTEFRCFMRNRKLVGISQYDCKNLGHCPNIAKYENKIRLSIESFFEQFRLLSHLDTVIFDVFLEVDKNMHEPLIKVKLLELNPFFKKTDYCLFEQADFDGSLRFL